KIVFLLYYDIHTLFPVVHIWNTFAAQVKKGCKNINGELTYTSEFISTLENLNHKDLSDNFRNYWKYIDNNNSSNCHSTYYKNHNPKYNWNWRDILNFIGFKEKNK
ncbi:MAG: hypothetical protein Q4E63_05340, partial [Prevotellaceae bacterium]|nr:hypothetical protein [Prevotellaceae bacterium]